MTAVTIDTEMLIDVCLILCLVSTVTKVSSAPVSPASEVKSVSPGVVSPVLIEERDVAGVIVTVDGLADGLLKESRDEM